MVTFGKQDGWHITKDGTYHFFIGSKSCCGISKTSDASHDNDPSKYCPECKEGLKAALRAEESK